MNLVRLANVSLQYPGGEVLKSVNLTVRKGEFVFLVGPTGAGKSTVLRMIYMAEKPSEGTVVVGRFNSKTITPAQIPLLRRQLGIVFQDFRLLEDRNVYDNVAFALIVTGCKQREIKRSVLRVLANVGLSHKRYRMPHELSGGEQQRVAIARALVNNPFILLADEPTGNLDPVTTAGIMELLEKINARGTAILMATHHYHLVEGAGKRVVRIEGGVTIN
ncbi:MAG: cell division ATP-binding protein FtsE [candidate division KSB1 bacterium]|nr:cell division ATP-binding protein FtsE [candidate division KSB1 bacterium]MDZ7274339.1 cell division ATP-binding protein FtsE [candidate division KSB1 bacterium]MDZ7284999.1 cell division ATP-binding protein FtsE [candidate division KSB1 bacterium]MDZ7297580.1 cell division ATP-binding protein FtsE [candidate division KSB1 bacterium]MDZ7308839.1 cell division ATP-binding protein FtsE [candidate division KSB1 bacterium]